MKTAEPKVDQEIEKLAKQVKEAPLPADLSSRTLLAIERLRLSLQFGQFSQEYEAISHYVEWLVNLPWQKKTEDNLDLGEARRVLDKYHYGLEEIKERVLEYLAVMKLKKDKGEKPRAPILCLVGLVGTGKTTLATAIAETLGRKMVRIPFGGIEEPFYLRGRSRVFPQAQPGQIIKGLRQAGAANPIILLDEIDRIAEEARSSIMGVLVELLDPEQNNAFTDYFIDYPFDLSEAFFITTCNNTTNISQAVLDRLEVISMPSYSDEEKIIIGKNYLLPEAIAEAGLEPQQVVFAPDVWPKIVRPLGYDAGVRTLKRNLEGICRQIAKKVVSGEGERFEINTNNVKEYLPMW
jgi:ATP-dependent Lon protease